MTSYVPTTDLYRLALIRSEILRPWTVNESVQVRHSALQLLVEFRGLEPLHDSAFVLQQLDV